ncbi:MAG: hypothetical protein IKD59_05435 [Lachnospiraceae bacterium]|nr:hypothetical protein [Lachnospiraceae bacterium]
MTREESRRFLYKIVTADGSIVQDKYERAKQLFDKNGIRMYAYSKNLKPTYILMFWKKPETAFLVFS